MNAFSRKGSVLVLVLWVLSFFAVLAVSLGTGARMKATVLSRFQRAEKLYGLAFSGIERARAMVTEDSKEEECDSFLDLWANAGSALRDVELAEGTFSVGYPIRNKEGKPAMRYGIRDEESKINLNKADVTVIIRLLEQTASLEKEDAEKLAYAIVDWRDQDSNYGHPEYGAEDAYYEDLRVPYVCKDAPFDSLDELLLIKGIKKEVFDKIKPFVTAYGSGSINLNTASSEALVALGLDRGAVDKILSFRTGPDGEDGTQDDVVFLQAQTIVTALDQAVPPLDGAQREALINLVLSEKLGTVSSYFSASSRGQESAEGPYLEIESVFDRSGKVYYSRSFGVKWPSKT